MKDLIIIGKGRAMLMAFMLVAYMLGICSCDHKDLCMNHSHMVDVDVSFDWSYAPDADPVAWWCSSSGWMTVGNATGASFLRRVKERPGAV